jgi:hypothetical protein
MTRVGRDGWSNFRPLENIGSRIIHSLLLENNLEYLSGAPNILPPDAGRFSETFPRFPRRFLPLSALEPQIATCSLDHHAVSD